MNRTRHHPMELGLLVLLHFVFSGTCFGAVRIIGEEKLAQLETKVPVMLARQTLKSGQWTLTEVSPRIIPKGLTPTPMESFMKRIMEHPMEKKTELVSVSDGSVSVRINGELQVLKRSHFFSKENWLAAEGWISSTFGSQLKEMDIKQASYLGRDQVQVADSTFDCHKLSIRMTIVGTSPVTGEEFRSPVNLTYCLTRLSRFVGYEEPKCLI